MRHVRESLDESPESASAGRKVVDTQSHRKAEDVNEKRLRRKHTPFLRRKAAAFQNHRVETNIRHTERNRESHQHISLLG